MSATSDNSPPNPTARETAPVSAGDAAIARGDTGEPLYCSLTGEPIPEGQVYWAPPLVTVGDLWQGVVTAVRTNPGNLGQILLGEQPDVPYAESSRQQLAARRSAEQAKLLGILLGVLLLIIALVALIVNVV